jgi:hypothetical protein
MKRLATLLLSLFVLIIWYGCETTSAPTPDPAATTKSDLVFLNNPTPGDGPYCRRSGEMLTIQVHNQGEADTGNGQIDVEIEYTHTATTATSSSTTPLQPGQTREFTFQLPADCYDAAGSCDFELTLDPSGWLSESNTGNNSASGTCTGDVHDDHDDR